MSLSAESPADSITRLKMAAATPTDTALAYTIAQAAKVAGIGRSTLYSELSAGKLQARKLGRRTLILASDLSLWLSSLPILPR